MTEDDLKQFVHQHTLAVIATQGESCPESAVIEFGDNGLELIFDTYRDSRKCQNIERSAKVSFVIGWDENKTVQYEGEAVLLKGDEKERYKQLYFAKLPEAQKWQHEPGILYYKVLPKWIRFSNLNVHPWDVKEFNF